MTVDIRCVVSCSLGEVISGNVNDEYVQGTGLIKCTGSIVINDIITPAVGTAVTISYTKSGVTRQLPRKLRVLSSFADPFRRTTSVELGCKLTYLADKKDKVNWDAFKDPNNTYTQEDAAIITIPIQAYLVAAECLYQLGIGGSVGLSNTFSIAKFDLSPGYVQVLGDLLVSESLCGYLDANEQLQVFPLYASGGTGPVIDASNLIDIAKIGVGQLPGEAVTVSYSTLKLKGAVQQTAPQDWDLQETAKSYTVPIGYTSPTNGISQTALFPILEKNKILTRYFNLVTSTGETLRLVRDKTTTYETGAAAIIGNGFSNYLSYGRAVYNVPVTKTTIESFQYDDKGNEIYHETAVSGDFAFIVGALGLTLAFSSTDVVLLTLGGDFELERTIIETITVGETQQVTTTEYGPWFKSLYGQQGVASANASLTSASGVAAFINKVANAGLVLANKDITVVRRIKPVSIPTQAEINNAANAKGGDPNNGYRTESTSELELALGSPYAQRRIELSMPYAPDDHFYKAGATYYSTPSDAPQKAKLFGICQNALLMGNRNGMNVQMAPELLPTAPFSPFMLTANGVTGMYRTNGTSWTFDANGMVVSTDGLFVGGVGGSGIRWFPVAPGITTLPTTPAVVDGQMTVTAVVPTANVTDLVAGTTRVGVSVTRYPYATQALSLVNVTLHSRLAFRLLPPPPAIVSGVVSPVLGNTAVTPTTVATNDGWSLVFDATADDSFTLTGAFGFVFTLNQVPYTACYVVSNEYITFGDGSTDYSGLNATGPALPKLHLGSDDFSYQRVYTKPEDDRYRIRWEGRSSTGGGPSNRFVEVIFYAPLPNNTQLIEVRSGDIAGSTSGPFMLATATTALATGTFDANSSWVFEGNADGTTWTLHDASHVE